MLVVVVVGIVVVVMVVLVVVVVGRGSMFPLQSLSPSLMLMTAVAPMTQT